MRMQSIDGIFIIKQLQEQRMINEINKKKQEIKVIQEKIDNLHKNIINLEIKKNTTITRYQNKLKQQLFDVSIINSIKECKNCFIEEKEKIEIEINRIIINELSNANKELQTQENDLKQNIIQQYKYKHIKESYVTNHTS